MCPKYFLMSDTMYEEFDSMALLLEHPVDS